MVTQEGGNGFLEYNNLLRDKIATTGKCFEVAGTPYEDILDPLKKGKNYCPSKSEIKTLISSGLGIKINGSYKDNQLVGESDLEKDQIYYTDEQRTLTLYLYKNQSIPVGSKTRYLDIRVDYPKSSGIDNPHGNLQLSNEMFQLLKTCPFNQNYVTRSEYASLVLTYDGIIHQTGTLGANLNFRIGKAKSYFDTVDYYCLGISIPEVYRSMVTFGSSVKRVDNTVSMLSDQGVYISHDNTMIYLTSQYKGSYGDGQAYPDSNSWIKFNKFGATWWFVYNENSITYEL